MKDEKRVVLFHCVQVGTLFTSALLSELYYQDYYKILCFQSSCLPLQSIIGSIQKTELFDEVDIINLKNNEVNEIENISNEFLKTKEVDVYHMYKYDSLSVVLMHMLNGKAKIIMTEEGGAIYNFKTIFELDMADILSKNNMHSKCFKKYPMMWDYIDEVMLYEPNARIDLTEYRCSRIEIEKLLQNLKRTKVFIEKLNDLFGYEPDLSVDNAEYIYMDSYLEECNYLDAEIESNYMMLFKDLLVEKRMAVKLHPSEKKNNYLHRYKNIDILIAVNSCVPWELVILNMYILNNRERKLILISVSSSSIVNSIIFAKRLGLDIYGIFTHKVIYNDLMYESIIKERGQQYLDKLEKLYENYMIQPKTYEELSLLLYGNKVNRKPDYRKRVNEYISFYGNRIEEALLKVCTGDELFLIKAYYDVIKEKNEIKFLLEKKVNGKVNFCLNMSSKKYYDNIKIEAVKIVCDNNTLKQIQAAKIQDLECSDDEINCILFCENAIAIIFEYRFEKKAPFLLENKDESRNNRLSCYNEVLIKWVKMYQNKEDITKKITGNKDKIVVIYGNGQLGNMLANQLKEAEVRWVYCVSSHGYDDNGIRVYGVDELNSILDEIGLIIVTPVHDYYSISNNIINVLGCEVPVISLLDFL